MAEYQQAFPDKKVALFDYMSSLTNVVGVIHFAAFKSVPESVDNPALYYHNNLESLINVVEACKKFNINNLIFSSSCSVYGNIDTLPVTENTPFSPAESPYAHTKQIGEQQLELYAKCGVNFKTIALRYFNPVGAHPSGLIGESPINPPTSLIPIITQTAIGKRDKMFVHGFDYPTRDGSCIRDYIHVCDIANAHVKALNILIEGKGTSEAPLKKEPIPDQTACGDNKPCTRFLSPINLSANFPVMFSTFLEDKRISFASLSILSK